VSFGTFQLCLLLQYLCVGLTRNEGCFQGAGEADLGMSWLAGFGLCVSAVEAGEMQFELELDLLADGAGPRKRPLVHELAQGRCDFEVGVKPSGLVDLEEILATAAEVALFQPVLNEVVDCFHLLEQNGLDLFVLVVLGVGLFALDADVEFALAAVADALVLVSFVLAGAVETSVGFGLRDGLHVVVFGADGGLGYEFV